ncbi:Blue-light-activated histidine kinase [Agrobacterium fabrum]|uniref:HWE histidine kinase domain-containing protein n=1 Tax=Agrobacterium fabrum TaxID=1176649 RepID=UPI001DE3EA74|nr:HWE histidine kinase domain-containing protein [Agrobacterium fabrum]CAH0273159.1 Blue-light-activated histidine kinase [Agrobacterium fabrum]CAH0276593.1 Blue-light-activated histidine kinase [Agrobacterium fabrum]
MEGRRTQTAIKSAGVALWTWIIDDDAFVVMDAKAYELWNVSVETDLTFEHLSPQRLSHRSGSGQGQRSWRPAPSTGFWNQLPHPDYHVRWISARGQGNEGDAATNKMTGIFLDVTGPKHAKEGHELLAGEMSHRANNLLALAAGLTDITSRSTATKEEMAKQLTQRLTALGRAHELVRPSGRAGECGTVGRFVYRASGALR